MIEGDRQGLPPGWAATQLRQVASINPSTDPGQIKDDDWVTFVPMRSVEPEGGGLVRPEIRRYREVRRGFTSFLAGDVIMAKITPCMENGKTTVVAGPPGARCFGSTEFHVVRTEDGIQARWIELFLLQHDVRRAAQREMVGGVGQMRVPASFLEQLSLPVAALGEQARVADAVDELFSDVDAGVAALERVRAKLKLYRVSVLKAAVEGALTAEWRAHHPTIEPAPELLDRILAERRRLWEDAQLATFKAKGQQAPKDWKTKYKVPAALDATVRAPLPPTWCWVTTEQACEFITKGTTPSGADAPRPAGDVPFIKVQHLSETGRFAFGDSPWFVAQPIHEGFLARSKVFPGDVLMNIVGPPLGQVSIVPALFPEWNVNQAIAIFRPVDGLSGRLLAIWLLSQPVLSQALRRTKTTAGQVNLTLEVCRTLSLPLPPASEQDAIVELVEDQMSVIDHLEADLDAKLESAKSLRQAILRHAFSGKLVPQDPDDEPASELLKRIAAEREERARSAESATGRKPRRAAPRKKP